MTEEFHERQAVDGEANLSSALDEMTRLYRESGAYRETGVPDFGLLDAPVAVEENAAYEVPDLKKIARAEEETREAMATVRDQASLNIANLATDGLHHFLANINGAELCGGCGDPFPCSTWTDDIEPRNQAWSSGGPVPGEDKARAIAELLGVDIEKARQIVLTSTPLDRL